MLYIGLMSVVELSHECKGLWLSISKRPGYGTTDPTPHPLFYASSRCAYIVSGSGSTSAKSLWSGPGHRVHSCLNPESTNSFATLQPKQSRDSLVLLGTVAGLISESFTPSPRQVRVATVVEILPRPISTLCSLSFASEDFLSLWIVSPVLRVR